MDPVPLSPELNGGHLVDVGGSGIKADPTLRAGQVQDRLRSFGAPEPRRGRGGVPMDDEAEALCFPAPSPVEEGLPDPGPVRVRPGPKARCRHEVLERHARQEAGMHKEDPVTHDTGRPSRVGLLEALRKTVDEPS
jgi:hypothetical protein